MWDRHHERFVELDDFREFPVTEDLGGFDDDTDAGAGLVTALLAGAFLWGSLACVLLVPWTRKPIGASFAMFAFLGVVYGLNIVILKALHPEVP